MIELANYNKVVAQRNKLLKEISFSGRMADTLELWDEQMEKALFPSGKSLSAA